MNGKFDGKNKRHEPYNVRGIFKNCKKDDFSNKVKTNFTLVNKPNRLQQWTP